MTRSTQIITGEWCETRVKGRSHALRKFIGYFFFFFTEDWNEREEVGVKLMRLVTSRTMMYSTSV